MDMFNDQLARQAETTGRPALAHQCRGRELSEPEQALADALSEVLATGVTDFGKVADALCKRGVIAPKAGDCNWTLQRLTQELAAINADLDSAYQESGYGA